MPRVIALVCVAVFVVVGLAACGGRSTPSGGPSCAAKDTAADCQSAAGCRWLEPGCAEGDETPLPGDAAGCYPAEPCGVANCPDTRACREVIVNPCVPNADGVACDACGETLAVCLP
jgi:hypothetical protein